MTTQGLPDQVTEPVNHFQWVKPLTGLGCPNMINTLHIEMSKGLKKMKTQVISCAMFFYIPYVPTWLRSKIPGPVVITSGL